MIALIAALYGYNLTNISTYLFNFTGIYDIISLILIMVVNSGMNFFGDTMEL